jgi:hypothetical protein
MAWLTTHSAVVGDIAAVYMTFQNDTFATDLMIYQIMRKVSATGLRDALFTFLIEDQGFRAMLGA